MRRTRKKAIIFTVTIILILYIFLMPNNKNKDNKFQDELIFFKLFSSGQKEENVTLTSKKQKNQSNNIYNFKVSYKNIDFKDIYLGDTIKKETLIYGKIAPRNKRRI